MLVGVLSQSQYAITILILEIRINGALAWLHQKDVLVLMILKRSPILVFQLAKPAIVKLQDVNSFLEQNAFPLEQIKNLQPIAVSPQIKRLTSAIAKAPAISQVKVKSVLHLILLGPLYATGREAKHRVNQNLVLAARLSKSLHLSKVLV